MKHSMNRRQFLAASIKAGTAVTLGSTLFGLSGCFASATPRTNLQLVADPKGICDLPKEFTYSVISKEGETMSDGLPVPSYHDGMGCFAGPDGATILVRNHEFPLYWPSDPPSPLPDFAYDAKSAGGTVTIWLDENLNVIRHYHSLTGTIRNCGGGATPWGTWVSCEEAHEGWMMGKRHGYNFEVNPLEPLRKGVPLKAMGRFNHEAIAVDPRSGIVYQTEDDTSSCFYRFVPKAPGKLEQGGRTTSTEDCRRRHCSHDARAIGAGEKISMRVGRYRRT